MTPFLGGAHLLFLAALACSRRTLEVCLSPGCVADGAQATLDRMKAFAPRGCVVEPGVCASACGAGPVVLELGDKSQRLVHKRVKGKALLDLLAEEDGEDLVPGDLVRGYDLVQDAEKALSERKFKEAVALYEEGIGLAIDMSTARFLAKSDCNNNLPAGVEWLVQAYCNDARARLGSFDKDGALKSAKSALELSRRSDPLCFEMLAEVCAAKKDTDGELEALQSMFALPEVANPPRDVANRRREWGFRLARLEREALKSRR